MRGIPESSKPWAEVLAERVVNRDAVPMLWKLGDVEGQTLHRSCMPTQVTKPMRLTSLMHAGTHAPLWIFIVFGLLACWTSKLILPPSYPSALFEHRSVWNAVYRTTIGILNPADKTPQFQ